jgi:Icc-related predicted phosphoesterase
MKFVAFSDNHGYLPPMEELPEGDVLLICGDILPLLVQRDTVASTVWFVTQFLPWTQTLSYKYIVFIGGNHDFLLCKLDISFMDYMDPHHQYQNVFYLFDDYVVLDGIKIYGTPYIQDLKNWAFYKNDNELLKAFKKIPDDTDILLTHMPPRVNMCGAVLQSNAFNYLSDFGSEALADVLLTKPNIKYSLFGHVHSGDHNITKNSNGTCLVNVSMKDEDYKRRYDAFVFELF